MDKDRIVESLEGTIKIVQYNNPRRKNALDMNMYIQVTKILNDAAKNDDITMTVITGTGDYYSSGNDIKAAIESSGDANILAVLKEFIKAFITFPKLLIAIVNGPAIGIAATTLALCDLVFASENAFFYTPFTKLGIVAEGCSTFTFPRLIGERKAAELLIYNHKMSAKEALECGFINYIYKPEELQSKVWEKIVEVSKLPKQSVLASKKLLRQTVQDDLLKANELELVELEKIWHSKEYLDNIIKFLNVKSKI